MDILKKIKSMPKIELHLHLDGSVNVKTALKIIQEEQITDYMNLNYKDLIKQMVVTSKLNSQRELLERFRIPIDILQSRNAIKKVAQELIESKAKENLKYCEVRFAPALHIQKKLTLDDVIEEVISTVKETAKKHNIICNFIVIGLKNQSLDKNLEMLFVANKYRNQGIVGVDLAGVEEDYLNIIRFKDFFLTAKSLGFYVTLHFGETLYSIPYYEDMIKIILPDRIAHGAICLKDDRVCELLMEHKIMLDICPTSNVQAGLFENYEDVPLRELYDRNILFSINTDDPSLSNINITEELENAYKYSQISIEELKKIQMNALIYSFADSNDKKIIMHELVY